MDIKKILQYIKKTAWVVFLAIFAFVAVIAIWLMIDKFIIGSPVPSVFGYSTLTVKTGSMAGVGEDSINIGDMIVIKKQDEYKIGDIVTYLHPGARIPTTHRIINYNPDGSFKTKGDSNNVSDDLPVTNDIILGKVVKIMPNVGVFTTWVQTEGWIYMVASLAILGLGFFIISSVEDGKNENAEASESEAQTEEQITEASTSEPNDENSSAEKADDQ